MVLNFFFRENIFKTRFEERKMCKVLTLAQYAIAFFQFKILLSFTFLSDFRQFAIEIVRESFLHLPQPPANLTSVSLLNFPFNKQTAIFHGLPLTLSQTISLDQLAREKSPSYKTQFLMEVEMETISLSRAGTLKVMLHETIRNNDCQHNTALQHCCDIVSSSYNIVPTLQRFVALKIVAANRPL